MSHDPLPNVDERLARLRYIDGRIGDLLAALEELHRTTIAALNQLKNSFGQQEVNPGDVSGPLGLQQRSYDDRLGRFQDALTTALTERQKLLDELAALGVDAAFLHEQRTLTNSILLNMPTPVHRQGVFGQAHPRKLSAQEAQQEVDAAIDDYHQPQKVVRGLKLLWQTADHDLELEEIAKEKAPLPEKPVAPIIDVLPPPPSPITEPGSPPPAIDPQPLPPPPPILEPSAPPIAQPGPPAEIPEPPKSAEGGEFDGLPAVLEEEDEELDFDDRVPGFNRGRPDNKPTKPPIKAPSVIQRDPAREQTQQAPSPKPLEPTRFSAYAPKEVKPQEWASLSAYIFRESASGVVEADAQQKFGKALAEYRQSGAPALQALNEGVNITATPRLEGFTFNPERLTLKFVKDWHRFDFEMQAGAEPLNLASNGAITFSMEGVLVAEIPLSVFVGQGAQGAQMKAAAVEADPYQKIFCSYSHRDTRVVERVERAYRVLGFDYLRDATRLRSGQQWNRELMKMIEAAQIFQLFWSPAAAQSPYVEQEWRHALQQPHANFIRPVYWKKPIVAPPPELANLHFAYDAAIMGTGFLQKLRAKLFE